MELNFFTRTKAGLAFGKIGQNITIGEQNPLLTSEGPAVYSPNGKYLAFVKPDMKGFVVVDSNDYSSYLDVCLL